MAQIGACYQISLNSWFEVDKDTRARERRGWAGVNTQKSEQHVHWGNASKTLRYSFWWTAWQKSILQTALQKTCMYEAVWVSPSEVDVARSRVGYEPDAFPHGRVEGDLEREAEDVRREELPQRSSSGALLVWAREEGEGERPTIKGEKRERNRPEHGTEADRAAPLI